MEIPLQHGIFAYIFAYKYNPTLAFVSLMPQADKRTQGGVQCFQIHGALYHRTGPLQHDPNVPPQFAQIFLYDPNEAIQRLQRRAKGLILALHRFIKCCQSQLNITVYLIFTVSPHQSLALKSWNSSVQYIYISV